MILDLHPPDTAGPLHLGATGEDTHRELRSLGTPLVLCGIGDDRSGWGIERPSGLFVAAYFDADDRVDVIQLGRPTGTDDAVTLDGIDIFATPAEDLLNALRARTSVVQTDEEDGSSYLARELHLTLWRPPAPTAPDDPDDRFVASVQLIKSIETDKIKPTA
jgi:hypothetical protein